MEEEETGRQDYLFFVDTKHSIPFLFQLDAKSSPLALLAKTCSQVRCCNNFFLYLSAEIS
jgi:hypothetical protein